jgi:flagellar export protein FliJ
VATFKFRLASVLRLREHIKDQKHWELRALYESRRDLVTEIDALESQLSTSVDVLAAGKIFTVLDLRLRAEYDQSLSKRVKAKRVALNRLDENIAEKRAELVEAMRAVKSLEQLRRRHEERYWRAQNLMQQRLSDEIAQRKFVQPQGRKKIPAAT